MSENKNRAYPSRDFQPDGKKKTPHTVMIDSRKAMSVTGVRDVPGFDETTISLTLDDLSLVIKGSGLHISKLSLDSGDVAIDGVISSLQYLGDTGSKSLRSKLFR